MANQAKKAVTKTEVAPQPITPKKVKVEPCNRKFLNAAAV